MGHDPSEITYQILCIADIYFKFTTVAKMQLLSIKEIILQLVSAQREELY